VRSDCWVEVRPTTSGAPTLDVTSRVEAIYGRSIRATVASTLAALDAADLSARVEDSGALPWTLVARVEAAVRRLRPAGRSTVLPEVNPATRSASDRHRRRRSRLYLPGNTPRYFVNAGLHQPDAVILDLEDSVAPEEKDAARLLVRAALRAVSFYGAEKMVRLNHGALGLEDARALAPHGVHTFLIPKCETAEDVAAVDDLVAGLRRDGALDADAEIFLIPLVESARGAFHALSIATAAPSVAALAIGLEDYTADIGAQRTADGRESAWAMGQIVNAARAAGVQPLASVFGDVDDTAGLRAWAQSACRLGFEGVGCVHPRQVRPVHEAFAPTAAEIERAAAVVAGYEKARAAGQGVVATAGTMVDAPVVVRARRVLERAAVVRGPGQNRGPAESRGPADETADEARR
jgi:citrate lyase subunit beta/citryl-CoA lyase